MSNLQAESDSAFTDPQARGIQESMDAENAALLPNSGGPAINFADEDGVNSPPPSLAYDGKGHQRKVAANEFADIEDGPATQFLDSSEDVQSTRQPRMLEDIHSAVEDSGRNEFDSRLLARAAKYGIGEQQARGQYQSPEQLERALLDIDQQTLNQGRWWRQQQQQRQQQPQWNQPVAPFPTQPQQQWVPQPQVQQQQPPQQQQQPIADDLEEYKLQNPEVFDDTLSEELQNLSKHTVEKIRRQNQRLQQLEAMVLQQNQTLQAQQQAQHREHLEREFKSFDQAIRNLGGGWEEVFGSDDHQVLPQNDPRIVNRAKTLQAAAELQQFHAMNGRNFALTDVLQSSIHLSFPDIQAVASSTKRQQRPRDQQGRYLAVPTSRKRNEQVTGREQALRRADAFFAKRGMPGDYGVEGGFADI